LGGGKKGIDKNAFSDWYGKRALTVHYYETEGESDELLPVADFFSRAFARQIGDFVQAAACFKAKVMCDEVSDLPDTDLKSRVGTSNKRPEKRLVETTAYD
jgi:hypothetical protein